MNSTTQPLISIVSPVYKAETIVGELVKQIRAAVEPFTADFEIILVNDCSPDNSWTKIKDASEKDYRVKGVHLSRNFGQHYAISAGLDFAKGDWVVVMDCDLQDRPDEIPNLYNKALEGWDIVLARRTDRKDKFTTRVTTGLFYRAYNYLSGLDTDRSIANFGIYRAKVIQEYNKMGEGARSFPSLVQFLGFKSCAIDVKHSERFDGRSSYTFATLFKLAGDVIISNSNKPLRMITSLGFIVSALSFAIAIYNVLSFYLGFIKVPGFTTTVFSIWFVGGLVLTVLGVIGIYVGRIFNEVKGRPLYIISKVVNIE
ncbi:glycosyltransferase family 2 protein [Maribacter algarum]|uniref:Glycosyltransferase family 2 protein n=1 Tax=Maribacter algarum (ex Zhang et al. 2020) TaxID=2578118 RepID=A0A5S3PVF6_9FLAO|nr:glycosyltransferase family 2 protein [Maribacter algarum]TMM58996.1 glycosyltransferase family 2 protein [Maribacter algarum]